LQRGAAQRSAALTTGSLQATAAGTVRTMLRTSQVEVSKKPGHGRSLLMQGWRSLGGGVYWIIWSRVLIIEIRALDNRNKGTHTRGKGAG
jgi:hypothetical protein